MNVHVIRAIFKRNFVSYFSNPTGYVFICVFVLLSSLAAFWPNEFFNANLANLDQLNKYLPFILLVFIPAITMSIWADERRQGTDELLLTIPAGDFDVVLGKYLAAVAIYSVSLLFSLLCNLAVLLSLGEPDVGLLLGTYFGYWLVGLAMLAIGMVASFLTGNLTVGFILGAVFNAPLVFAAMIDAIPTPQWVVSVVPDWTSRIKSWSIEEQFRDFSRGVISLSGIAFFLGIVALMLYLSIVLIGRRHWRGGQEGRGVALHYLVRFVSLAIVVLGLNIFLARHDRLRLDVTSEGLSSLSPKTREVMRQINETTKHPIHVEAYISSNVPENYVQTRLNLISTLSELRALSANNNLSVYIHDVEPLSKEATLAEEKFGIKPQAVETRTRGARTQEQIFMGVAVTCGLDKVVVPFINKGVPVEYELVRSIATVSQQKRKKIGVVTTDAKLYGGFDMQTMGNRGNELIIDELQKQYDVSQVDPSKPIGDEYDVLLAVQPSSLGPEQMKNFIDAVKQGRPTAIFEDPFPTPFLAGDVAGTNAPKQPPGGMNPFMMQQRQPPQPKGDIGPLWKMLGVRFHGEDVVWQDYNPYPKASSFLTPEWVFVDHGCGTTEPFNDKDPISAKLQQVLLPFPGALEALSSAPSSLTFTELIAAGTGDRRGPPSGTVEYDKILERSFLGQPRMNPELYQHRKTKKQRYVLAAHIQGKLKAENLPMSDKSPEDDKADEDETEEVRTETPDNGSTEKAKKDDQAMDIGSSKGDEGEPVGAFSEGKENKINVVVVADIDCLYSAFFMLRARGEDAEDELDFNFDNVTFILNVLDDLAGDSRFIEIRRRRPVHRTLTTIADKTQRSRERRDQARLEEDKKVRDAIAEEQEKLNKKIAALRKEKHLSSQDKDAELSIALQDGQRRLEAKTQQLKQERDQKNKEIDRDLAREVRDVQDGYKLSAVLLPPIPPLLVAFFVFFNRRAREREGVSKARLR